MKILVKTNNLALITLIETLLKEEKINYVIFDQNMSILEGSIGAIPRRIMVTDDDYVRARRVLTDAEIGVELTP